MLIDDRGVPEDEFADACVNELDRYYDESHVRRYRPSEWHTMPEEAGSAVEPTAAVALDTFRSKLNVWLGVESRGFRVPG